MGNRLSKIVTRTGDNGTTGLADGSRCFKDNIQIQAIGDVDELNSWIGMVRCKLNGYDDPMLENIQHRLFDIGGELCMPGVNLLEPVHISNLEEHVETLNSQLEPLKNFILPYGSDATCTIHIARTVCRKAERSCVTLMREYNLTPLVVKFLNRLSDYLFVLARLNERSDTLWQQKGKS